MLKKILFFIVLFSFFGVSLNHSAEILPLKKPVLSIEEKQKKLLIEITKPLPKPITKSQKKVDKNEKSSEKVTISGLILPKKKPLIPGKKKAAQIKISKYYNKKDFNLAKKAISEMKRAKWPNALKTAKKAKDKSIYNFIQWRHLLTKGNQASYYDYKTFIDINEDYPRIGRVKYLAEHKLSTNKVSPKKIIDWYGSSELLSGFGRMILGESYTLTGDLSLIHI